MLQDLAQAQPLLYVSLQHSPQQLLPCLADRPPNRLLELQTPRFHAFQYFDISAALEGRLSAKHNIEDDPKGPNIAFLIVISQKDLRRNVVRGANPLPLANLRAIKLERAAEIDHLEHSLGRIIKYIFGLEVPAFRQAYLCIMWCSCM